MAEVALNKIQDHPSLAKDPSSKAVLNTNVSALQAYKAQRNFQSTLQEKANEVDCLRDEVKELKSMLTTILNRLG